jgi:hypothetical protein
LKKQGTKITESDILELGAFSRPNQSTKLQTAIIYGLRDDDFCSTQWCSLSAASRHSSEKI